MKNSTKQYATLNIEQKIAMVTELHYLYHMSQAKIAELLGISRPWVSKLLSRAEEMNLVKISVLTPTAGVVELESALVEKYKIKNARVMKNIEGISSLKACAVAASHHLISTIQPNDKIGVCFGRTLAAMVDIFDSIYFPNAIVVPLVGGLGDDSSIMSNHIAENLANRLGCEFRHLHAPALLDESSKKEIFMSDSNIKEVFDIAHKVNIALFSPGDLTPQSSLLRDKQISDAEYDELTSLGVVGDIALNFFDKNGSFVEHKVHDRAIAIDYDMIIKNARDKIAVAIGESKVPSLNAALTGGWIDTLITDSSTAIKLLAL